MVRVNAAALLLLLLLWSISLTIASAADFQTGVEAYNGGDFQTAYAEFYELAQQGHLDAQNNLGVLYQTGHGVSQDYLTAARWYRQAARRGHSDAQSNLAALYVNGYGVPQDYMMAYAWFNLAATQGVEGAQQHRDVIAAHLTTEQIRRAQQITLMAPAIKPSFADNNSGYYGPVSAGETLWSIANRVKPTGVSTQTMVTALIRENPDAFSTANGSGLKVGSRLRVPGSNAPPSAQQTLTITHFGKQASNNAGNPESNTAQEKIIETNDTNDQPSNPHYYGPVTAGETLWSIANQLKPDKVSTSQMSIALQRANPDAFSSQTPSSLKVNARLRIPVVTEIAQLARN